MHGHQPTRRTALRTIMAAAASLVSLRVGHRAAAQSLPKIVLGTIAITPLIASYIGEVDYFRDEGLDVELARFPNFAPILQGMTTGRVAAGEIGVAPSIIAATRGLPLIAPFMSSFSAPNRPFERIMVLPESPIRTLDDLKDRKLAFLGPGTVPDMLLNGLPRRTKIRKEDIKLVPMPAPSMPDALAQGLVDAIFAIPPADTVAEQKYRARTIINATELVPYAGLASLAISRDFAETNPETAKKLFRACIRFMRWIDDNAANARQVAAKNIGIPADFAASMRIPLFARNGLPVMPNVWNLYEMLVQAKTIDRHPDPAKVFDATIVEPTKRFVLPALDSLGPQPDHDVENMLKAEYPFLPKPPADYYADWEKSLLKL